MIPTALYVYDNQTEVLVGMVVAPDTKRALSMVNAGFDSRQHHSSVMPIQGRDNSLLSRLRWTWKEEEVGGGR